MTESDGINVKALIAKWRGVLASDIVHDCIVPWISDGPFVYCDTLKFLLPRFNGHVSKFFIEDIFMIDAHLISMFGQRFAYKGIDLPGDEDYPHLTIDEIEIEVERCVNIFGKPTVAVVDWTNTRCFGTRSMVLVRISELDVMPVQDLLRVLATIVNIVQTSEEPDWLMKARVLTGKETT